jgi:EAL domain-containing protein (putative c-di-GMP-specific phosphodiesterase class I)
LKLDKLKIDKSFVKNIHQVDTRLVDLIIMIGVRFGMTVIAEGVESESDRDALISMGCDQAQGYFYSKPVPLPEFIEKFIENKG